MTKMQGILLRAPQCAAHRAAFWPRVFPNCRLAFMRLLDPERLRTDHPNLTRALVFARRVLLERPPMASRWIGLARRSHGPALVRTFANRKRRSLKRKRSVARAAHAVLHAAGAFGMFLCATTFNLIVFPEVLTSPAYAQTLASLEGEIGFFSMEPAIPAPPPAPIVDEAEVHLLAATTWAEARSQGEDGMRAVAHVVVNRIGPRFGENLETVVLRPKQFSAWNHGDPNRPLALNPELYAQSGADLATWESAQAIAREVLTGQSADPTGGALFYHTRAVRPSWARFGVGRLIIGQHVFYHDVPNQRQRRRASVHA